MLIFKDGVKIGSRSVQLEVGSRVAEGVFDKYGYDCVVTSSCDFKHSAKYSEHYQGNADDLRTKHVRVLGKPDRTADHELKEIFNEIKAHLPKGFVLLHENKGGVHEHFHMAWRPKYDDR